jgi:hypothetical protein
LFIFEVENPAMRYCIYALLLILSGCASSYKPLRPNATYYPTTNTESGLEFSYKLGVLRENGNKKYAKREDRKAIRLASVKIVNTSDRSYTVGSNLKFYSGNSELILIDPATLHRELKQGVPIYLLYLLMTPIQFYSTNSSGQTTSTPIGVVLGPGLAIGNMVGAGGANQNFLKELNTFNLINKTIKPGETVYGIIGIRDIGYNPINIKVLNNQQAGTTD